MMKMAALLIGLLPAFALGGQWRYQDAVDQMTGKTASYASLKSDNSLSLSSPYDGVNFGTLHVRKHPKYGTDVFVKIEKGQILCRSYDPCRIAVKFDNAAPRAFEGLSAADNSTETVFLESTGKFIAAAKKAKKILIQIPLHRGGEQVLEFTTPVELVWKTK